MKHVPVFLGTIDASGKVHLRDPQKYARYVRALGAGLEVEVTVKERRPKRSLKSNRYWWGLVLRTMADELGYADPDELHEAIVFKFRPLPPDELTGAPRRMRTSQMTNEEFQDFTSQVIQWAEADLGIRIPRPGELDLAEAG